MFCKNCGREIPDMGQFCPFCGAPLMQGDVNDETTIFKPPAGQEGPIDLSAFNAALQDTHYPVNPGMEDGVTTGDPLSITGPGIQPPPRPVRRTDAPHTTYFEPEPYDGEPYRKPSAGKKVGIAFLVIILIGALVGGGVWFVVSHKPDENLTAAEKYMTRGKFEEALAAYQDALPAAKDPAPIQLQIDQLKTYQQAKAFMENGDYASALATLSDLKGRINDSSSALSKEVDEMQEQAQLAIEDKEFANDITEAQTYLSDGKYDAAAAKLDSLEADGGLSSEQQAQVKKLQQQLSEAREAAQRQEENRQEKAEKKEYFRKKIASIEESDKKILKAKNTEEELKLTTDSFNSWNSLLDEMYDYLATVLNADLYAAEEESYKQWLQERDAGAANAASESSSQSEEPEGDTEKDSEKTSDSGEKTEGSSEKSDKGQEKPKEKVDNTAGELASVSFKQSYTKTRCYKVLDLME